MKILKSFLVRVVIVMTIFMSLECQKEIMDSRMYAPLKIGNRWTYIQNFTYGSGYPGITSDSIAFIGTARSSRDSIYLQVEDAFLMDGHTAYSMLRSINTVDSTIYHLIGRDTVLVIVSQNIYRDTLLIIGDSIKTLNNLNGYAPFFDLQDYPDACKNDVAFEGKMIKMADWRGGYYLDTYGLIYWEFIYYGNGDNWSHKIILKKFNDELIDRNEIIKLVNK